MCPDCGSGVQDGTKFCTGCGADLRDVQAPAEEGEGPPTEAPPGSTGAGPSPPPRDGAPSGPSPPPDGSSGLASGAGIVGPHREPMLVAVLGVLTLGFYFWYWLWKTSEECERFDPEGPSPHLPVKIGLGGIAVGIASWMFIFFIFIGASGAASDPAASGEALEAAGVGAMIFSIVALLGFFIGMIALLVGMYRVWKWIEFHETEIGYRDSLSAGVMLLIYLGGGFVSGLFIFLLIGFLLMPLVYGYVLYRTQKGMNRVWEAAEQGYQVPTRRSPQVAGRAQQGARR